MKTHLKLVIHQSQMARDVAHLHKIRGNKLTPFSCIFLSTPNLKKLLHMCPCNSPSQNEISYVHEMSTSIFHLLSGSQVKATKFSDIE